MHYVLLDFQIGICYGKTFKHNIYVNIKSYRHYLSFQSFSRGNIDFFISIRLFREAVLKMSNMKQSYAVFCCTCFVVYQQALLLKRVLA